MRLQWRIASRHQATMPAVIVMVFWTVVCQTSRRHCHIHHGRSAHVLVALRQPQGPLQGRGLKGRKRQLRRLLQPGPCQEPCLHSTGIVTA